MWNKLKDQSILKVDIDRLTCWQIPAFVFCLFAATFQPLFAVEEGYHTARRLFQTLAMDAAARVLGPDHDIVYIDVDRKGSITILHTDGSSILVENVPVTNLQDFGAGRFDVTATFMDPDGSTTRAIDVSGVAVVDNTSVSVFAVASEEGELGSFVSSRMTSEEGDADLATLAVNSSGYTNVTQLWTVDPHTGSIVEDDQSATERYSRVQGLQMPELSIQDDDCASCIWLAILIAILIYLYDRHCRGECHEE